VVVAEVGELLHGAERIHGEQRPRRARRRGDASALVGGERPHVFAREGGPRLGGSVARELHEPGAGEHRRDDPAARERRQRRHHQAVRRREPLDLPVLRDADDRRLVPRADPETQLGPDDRPGVRRVQRDGVERGAEAEDPLLVHREALERPLRDGLAPRDLLDGGAAGSGGEGEREQQQRREEVPHD
jgi:hypothetical protein